MNGASASTWGTMPAPNALWFVQLGDPHEILQTSSSRHSCVPVRFLGCGFLRS